MTTTYLDWFLTLRNRRPESNSAEFLNFNLMIHYVRRRNEQALIELLETKKVNGNEVQATWFRIHKKHIFHAPGLRATIEKLSK